MSENLDSSKETVRVSANLPEETFKMLKELAAKRGVSMTEILRRAVALEDYVDEAIDEGGKILVEKRDGEMRQLLFR